MLAGISSARGVDVKDKRTENLHTRILPVGSFRTGGLPPAKKKAATTNPPDMSVRPFCEEQRICWVFSAFEISALSCQSFH